MQKGKQRVNRKITKTKLITTHMAENIIKAAPKQKNTSLFPSIKAFLAAKDLKYQEKY